MKVSKALSAISRRDLFRLSGQFGLSSVVLGAGAFAGAATLPEVVRAAQTVDACAAPLAVAVYCRADVRAAMPAVGDVSDARGSVPFRLCGAF